MAHGQWLTAAAFSLFLQCIVQYYLRMRRRKRKLSWWTIGLDCVQERQFKQTSSVDQLAIHFALDGNMLHKDSDEARRQRQKMGIPDSKSQFTSLAFPL